jgi:hypothetical protein
MGKTRRSCKNRLGRLDVSRCKASKKATEKHNAKHLKQKRYAATTAVLCKNDRNDTRFGASVVHDACDFGLRSLIFTPSMARSTSSAICCDVRPCQTGKGNIEERQGSTEKKSPILTIDEYFADSLVFGTFASASAVSGGAAPKSSSIGNRQSRVEANMIGDCQR